MSKPTSATREQPSQRLAGLGHIIAGVRGSPIECYGTMDLLQRNARGEKWRIMQADQSVYLHPGRPRLPTEAMEIGWHDRPDKEEIDGGDAIIAWVTQNDAGYDFDTCGDNRRIPMDLDGLKLVRFLPLPAGDEIANQGVVPEI